MARFSGVKTARLVWAAILVAAVTFSCSARTRPSASSPPIPEKESTITAQGSQIVIYAREPQASGLPIAWEIRKIALNKADGSQTLVPGTDTVLKTSGLEMGSNGGLIQNLVAVAEVPQGDYSGLSFFTRAVYYEDTGSAIPTDATIVTVNFGFSIIPGAAKTIIVVAELSPPGVARASFRFEPRLAVEDEVAAPKGKVIFVSNELSANVSVIDKTLKRVVKNVYIGTRPAALGADQRRNRLYIAGRKAGVIYEMDMLSQRLSNATQIEYVDEPIHIEPIPTRDLLIVVNFGTDTIYLVDAFNLGIVQTLAVGDGPVDAIYSTFVDRAFVVNMMDGTLSVLDLESSPAEVDTTIEVELRPSAITTDDNAGLIYVTNSGSPDLSVIKIEPRTLAMAIERTFTIGIGAGDVTMDPFGKKLFVAMTETNEILCIDPYTGVTVYSVRLPAKPGKLMFDSDEKKLYATVPARNAVVVIDTITREIQNWIETGQGPSSMAIRL